MKTRNTLRRVCDHLALVVGLIGAVAWVRAGIPQALTWYGTTNDVLALNVAYPLSATSNFGRPVTLKVDGGPAVIADGTITVTAFGPVTVTAEQAGDANYAAARVIRRFNGEQVQVTRVGTYAVPGSVNCVDVVGKYAYVASGDLQVVDVSNPGNPVRVGRYATDAAVHGVDVVGNYAYLAVAGEWDGQKFVRAGLVVVDVTNPAMPVRAGGYATDGNAEAVQVVGNFAYLVGSGGLHVLDVSDPVHPARVGGFSVLDDALGLYLYGRDVQAVGDFAYVAGDQHGLQAFDVRNPAKPLRVGGHGTDLYALGISVAGDHAFVADIAGLQVFDVGSPSVPLLVGQYHNRAIDVQVVGKYAFVTADSALDVIDVSDPAKPTRAGVNYMGGNPNVVTVVGNRAYVGTAAEGMKIFEWAVFVAGPQLGLRRAQEQTELFWSAGLAGFQLQGCESLAPGSQWQNVTTTPVEANGEARVALDAASSLRYFRLSKP